MQAIAAAQQAADRYADEAFAAGDKGLPGGFGQKGIGSSNLWCGIAYDKSLEWLCWHPRIWPLILELTDNRPQMNGPGTMIVDDVDQAKFALPHQPIANGTPTLLGNLCKNTDLVTYGKHCHFARIAICNLPFFSDFPSNTSRGKIRI